MRHLLDKNIFQSNFDPLENNHSSGRRVLIEATHRRALDLSENGTSRSRYRISMPIGVSDRQVKILIECQLGNVFILNAIIIYLKISCASLFLNNTYYIFTNYISIQTLTKLDLWYNGIGAEGTQHLAQALQNNMVKHIFCFSTTYSSLCFNTGTHHAQSLAQ
jgi:hypothetical protein